jgi:protein tyrosine/serine phosphatase
MRTNLLFTSYATSNPTTKPLYIRKPEVKIYDEITEYLYVGGIESSQKEWSNFKLIVNCTKDISFPSQKLEKTDPECIRISVNDIPDECDNMTKYMRETNVLERMHEHIRKGEPVLVHCFAGMQRSCAIVACYLIKYHKVTPAVAMDHIKRKRPVAFFGGANFLKTILEQPR